MKRVYITLGTRVVSEGIKPEDKGDLIILDLDSKKVLQHITLKGRDNIKRGRSRGPAGLAFFEDYLYVATRGDLIALDPVTLKEDHYIDLLFQGVHQIKSHGGLLHLSTMIRNLKQLVKNRKVIDIVPTIYSGIGSDILPGGYFNALDFSPSGEEYHQYGGKKEIWNISKNKLVYTDTISQAPHDICFLDEENLLYTRSIEREVIKLHIPSSKAEVVFRPPCIIQSDPNHESNFSGFLRGIALSKTQAFILSNPATLYIVDLVTWQIQDTVIFLEYDLPKEEIRQRCPFDIILDPNDWREI